MTVADKKLIDDSIIKHGDDFWNDFISEAEPNSTNRGWIVEELLVILAEDDLDLKVVRKK